MFDKLRAKIDGHFTSSPLASQRKDFLSIDASTPIEKKAHFTAEVVGAAAAYEAFKAFERHEVHKGAKPTHARAKEVIWAICLASPFADVRQIIVGLATGFASKMIDEKGLPFTSEANKVKFKKEAQIFASRDAKRAVRESNLYDAHEMEAIDADEKHGAKII